MTSPVRPFTVYRNPETSEVSSEHTSLIEAMLVDPTPNAAIIRNGVTLAEGVNGGWTTTPEGLAEFSRIGANELKRAYAKTA